MAANPTYQPRPRARCVRSAGIGLCSTADCRPSTGRPAAMQSIASSPFMRESLPWVNGSRTACAGWPRGAGEDRRARRDDLQPGRSAGSPSRHADGHHHDRRICIPSDPGGLAEEVVGITAAQRRALADDSACEVDRRGRIHARGVMIRPGGAPGERGGARICPRSSTGWTRAPASPMHALYPGPSHLATSAATTTASRWRDSSSATRAQDAAIFHVLRHRVPLSQRLMRQEDDGADGRGAGCGDRAHADVSGDSLTHVLPAVKPNIRSPGRY